MLDIPRRGVYFQVMDTQNQDVLDQSLRALEALSRLAEAISSTTSTDEIINTIIQEASDLTEASQGSILLTQETMDAKFTTLVRLGTTRHEVLVQKMGMVIAGWVLKNKTHLMANDIILDDRFKGLQMLGYPVQSVVAAPIQAGGKILGVLILHTREDEKRFAENDLRLVNIIASQSAHILATAQMLRQLRDENQHLKQEVERRYSFHEIIGRSAAMQKVFKLLDKVIPTDARVLIQGESGTGKELIARALHYNGQRKSARFVAIDCGALPENLLESELFGHVKGAFTGAAESKKGLFSVADGGTLFLDEINNTSSALQAKLLRAIQEREIRPLGGTKTIKVDVRIACASSRDLADCVRDGSFRQDLYFRLKVVTVKLPALRERRDDIPILAQHFLDNFNNALGKRLQNFSAAALEQLRNYSWPGNIRELENAVEQCVTMAEPDAASVEPELLPEEFHGGSALNLQNRLGAETNLTSAVEELERAMVTDALKQHNGNRTRAAAHLGLSRRGLLNKIERYGL